MTNATTKATYAVLSAYAQSVLRPIEITASIIFALAVAGTTYLIVQFSAWWWLLMILVILYGVLGSILWLILHYTLDRITPVQTSSQKKAVAAFVSKTKAMADSLQISQFSLLLRVVQDVFHRKQTNVLTEFANGSTDLKKEFEHIIQQFES